MPLPFIENKAETENWKGIELALPYGDKHPPLLEMTSCQRYPLRARISKEKGRFTEIVLDQF